MPDRHSYPHPFAIYYGWPSALPSRERLLREFRAVFLGAGLESSGHPDHESARDLVSCLRDGGVSCCGYFNLAGIGTELSIRELEYSLKSMTQIGMDGVLLDNSGRDHDVDKRTRKHALDTAHSFGLGAVLNAGDPGEVLFGLPLKRGDGYMLEGYRLADGVQLSGYTMDAKCDEAKRHRDRYGISLFAVATLEPGAGEDSTTAGGAEGIRKLWDKAEKDELDYFLITDPLFGASGPSKDRISALR